MLSYHEVVTVDHHCGDSNARSRSLRLREDSLGYGL